jgi:hypothetical protein
MTSVDERDEQVLKHRLLDGMQEVSSTGGRALKVP